MLLIFLEICIKYFVGVDVRRGSKAFSDLILRLNASDSATKICFTSGES